MPKWSSGLDFRVVKLEVLIDPDLRNSRIYYSRDATSTIVLLFKDPLDYCYSICHNLYE